MDYVTREFMKVQKLIYDININNIKNDININKEDIKVYNDLPVVFKVSISGVNYHMGEL